MIAWTLTNRNIKKQVLTAGNEIASTADWLFFLSAFAHSFAFRFFLLILSELRVRADRMRITVLSVFFCSTYWCNVGFPPINGFEAPEIARRRTSARIPERLWLTRFYKSLAWLAGELLSLVFIWGGTTLFHMRTICGWSHVLIALLLDLLEWLWLVGTLYCPLIIDLESR